MMNWGLIQQQNKSRRIIDEAREAVNRILKRQNKCRMLFYGRCEAAASSPLRRVPTKFKLTSPELFATNADGGCWMKERISSRSNRGPFADFAKQQQQPLQLREKKTTKTNFNRVTHSWKYMNFIIYHRSSIPSSICLPAKESINRVLRPSLWVTVAQESGEPTEHPATRPPLFNNQQTVSQNQEGEVNTLDSLLGTFIQFPLIKQN